MTFFLGLYRVSIAFMLETLNRTVEVEFYKFILYSDR